MTLTRHQAALEAQRRDIDFHVAWADGEITREAFLAGRDALAAEADRLFDLACQPLPTDAPVTAVQAPVAPVVPQDDAVAPEARIPSI